MTDLDDLKHVVVCADRQRQLRELCEQFELQVEDIGPDHFIARAMAGRLVSLSADFGVRHLEVHGDSTGWLCHLDHDWRGTTTKRFAGLTELREFLVSLEEE